MKNIIGLSILAMILVGCSGHLGPDRQVKFGKKCAVKENGSIVYSYIWLHSKDVELEADKETCELIKKIGK